MKQFHLIVMGCYGNMRASCLQNVLYGKKFGHVAGDLASYEHSGFHYLLYLYLIKFFNVSTKGNYLDTSLWQCTTKLHEIQRKDILNLRCKLKTSC